MDIANIKIEPVKNHIKTRAKVTLEIDGGLVLRYIQIIEDRKGVRVQWPKSVFFKDVAVASYLCNRILATWVINHCS